jgi:poly(3-hydroxybutyrate) depolymerase
METDMRQNIATARRSPARALTGLFAKIGFSLALGAAALSAPAAWAGSWNSAQEVLNNHGTWIYTPTSTLSNGKHALVIALHGCDQTNTQLKDWGNVTPAAENKAAVIALPYVGSNVWSGNTAAKCWNYDGASDGSSHIAELVTLATTLAGRPALNIDARHVYIIGLSSGASIALDVACKAPDLFAGVSALAGPSVGSQQFSATSAGSGIFYTAASAAQKCKDLAGTAKLPFFATQIANIAYGEKDKDAESPGCTYSSGNTSCPGTYQLVSKKWSTINVDSYISIYGAGALGSASAVSGGTTAVAQVGGATRISLTKVSGVGHAWPAGSGVPNDVSKGGVWMAQTGMNYADYSIGWLMANNQRAGVPDVTLTTSVAGTTISYSGNVSATDPISTVQSQLYAWNGSGYAASGAPVNLGFAGGAYSSSFSVADNTFYQITVTATTNTNRSGSKTVSQIQVGNPQPQWNCAGTTVTSSNNAHVTAGRAHDVSGYAYANGSNQKLTGGGGLDNLFYTSTLSATAQGYWINGNCP